MANKFGFNDNNMEDDMEFMPIIPMVEDDDTAQKDVAEILPIH
jgi:hypothetical protein